MKFWLPAKVYAPNVPSIVEDNPNALRQYGERGIRVVQGRLVVAKLKRLPDRPKGLVIQGIKGYETKDRNEVVTLIKVGGSLRFNAQDAVDEGILTAAEVQALGYDAVGPDAEEKVAAPVAEAPPPVLPDLNTMTKDRMVKFGLDQTPPINLDPRKRKDDMRADLEAALAERK